MNSTSGIFKHVLECIKEHEGGEKFFDDLDDRIRKDRKILSELVSYASSMMSPDVIVLSGKFGVEYGEIIYDQTGIDVVCLEGGLRFNEVQDPGQYAMDFNGRTVMFLDDTYFAGRTSDKVQQLVENCYGMFLGTCVVYDGSQHKKPHVHSLFRYYDHFGKDKKALTA